MNEHHYQRIDKGTKRDYRALARRQPRTNKGTFGLMHSPESRAAVILDALNSLPAGESTDSIAARHNIPGPTLRAWLLADESLDNAANSARRSFLSFELSLRASDIDNAADPLTLARAREAFRAWAWIAERREARLYGMKQEVTHEVGQSFTEALLSIIKARQLRDTGVMSNPNPLITNESPITDADIVADVPQKDPSP